MYSLIYISSVYQDFSEKLISDISEVSREKNKFHGITGLLLLNEYQIIQYIEGDEKSVKQLYKNISNDKRHTNIFLIKEEPIKKRLFADWHIGYKNIKNLNKKELKFITNYDFHNISELPLIFQKFLKIGS